MTTLGFSKSAELMALCEIRSLRKTAALLLHLPVKSRKVSKDGEPASLQMLQDSAPTAPANGANGWGGWELQQHLKGHDS